MMMWRSWRRRRCWDDDNSSNNDAEMEELSWMHHRHHHHNHHIKYIYTTSLNRITMWREHTLDSMGLEFHRSLLIFSGKLSTNRRWLWHWHWRPNEWCHFYYKSYSSESSITHPLQSLPPTLLSFCTFRARNISSGWVMRSWRKFSKVESSACDEPLRTDRMILIRSSPYQFSVQLNKKKHRTGEW